LADSSALPLVAGWGGSNASAAADKKDNYTTIGVDEGRIIIIAATTATAVEETSLMMMMKHSYHNLLSILGTFGCRRHQHHRNRNPIIPILLVLC
jgi:hypothetical protein